jgi:hypothetical protein
VQGNGFPDGLYLLFRDVMCGEELPGSICPIDLEAFVLAREVVKCGGYVEEFSVETNCDLIWSGVFADGLL